ncbi:MAG: flagellar type III secretion system protein FliQ [Planctomycetales bacterium]|nr:flagellar type III secretion system protein FliQ [Planctomycetales bacterium]
MQPQDVIDLVRESLIVALLIGAPLLVVGLVVGLLGGLFQSITQIQDQSVVFVPKLIAVAAALAVGLPWLLDRMLQFSHQVFSNAPRLLSGG